MSSVLPPRLEEHLAAFEATPLAVDRDTSELRLRQRREDVFDRGAEREGNEERRLRHHGLLEIGDAATREDKCSRLEGVEAVLPPEVVA